MKCGVNMHNCLYICQVALIGAHCKILRSCMSCLNGENKPESFNK